MTLNTVFMMNQQWMTGSGLEHEKKFVKNCTLKEDDDPE